MVEHHIGELVVAVHDARRIAAGGAAPEPVARGVEAGDVSELEAFEVGVPAVDLALVETVGAAEALKAIGLPIHLGQPGDGIDQLVGQTGAGVDVGPEWLGPAGLADGRPAVYEVHEVEGRPDNAGVVGATGGPGVGDVGVGQGGEDAELPHHGLVAAFGNLAGWAAQGPAVLAPADLEDLV